MGARPNRALTEILIAAGKEKAISAAGGHVARKKLLANMIWFLKANRESDDGAYRPVDKVCQIQARDWFEIVKWHFALNPTQKLPPEGSDKWLYVENRP